MYLFPNLSELGFGGIQFLRCRLFCCFTPWQYIRVQRSDLQDIVRISYQPKYHWIKMHFDRTSLFGDICGMCGSWDDKSNNDLKTVMLWFFHYSAEVWWCSTSVKTCTPRLSRFALSSTSHHGSRPYYHGNTSMVTMSRMGRNRGSVRSIPVSVEVLSEMA